VDPGHTHKHQTWLKITNNSLFSKASLAKIKKVYKIDNTRTMGENAPRGTTIMFRDHSNFIEILLYNLKEPGTVTILQQLCRQ